MSEKIQETQQRLKDLGYFASEDLAKIVLLFNTNLFVFFSVIIFSSLSLTSALVLPYLVIVVFLPFTTVVYSATHTFLPLRTR